jgi:predicted nucleic acid-binding protein
MTTVVDASAIVDLLLDVVPERHLHHFAGDLVAPDLMLAEVANALARLERHGHLDPMTAQLLLDELRDAPIEVDSTRGLMGRAFELRPNVNVYDGCYVALAESLGCPLVTADARLGGVPGLPVATVLI